MNLKKIAAAAMAVFVMGGAVSEYAPFQNYIMTTEAGLKDWVGGINYSDIGDYAIVVDCDKNLSELIVNSYFDDYFERAAFYRMWVLGIGDSAFEESQAESISLPDCIQDISDTAFIGCNKLEKFSVYKNDNRVIGNPGYSTSPTLYTTDNCLFQKKDGKNTLIRYPSKNMGFSYKVPDTVDSIHPYAFQHSTDLFEITLGAHVTSVGSYAFDNCYNLEKIVLSNGISRINPYTFYRCEKLGSITLPESLEYIDEGAFSECDSLKEIVIPSNVKEIGKSAFNCQNLERITILNPECKIYSDYTGTAISNIVTIIAPKNSQAELYAKMHNNTFIPLNYTVNAALNDDKSGTVSGGGVFEYGNDSETTIEFTPAKGYHFTHWEDINGKAYIENPLTVKVNGDMTYTAYASNEYRIDVEYDSKYGTIDGAGMYEYGTKYTLTATPNHGYEFASWGLRQDPNPIGHLSASPTITRTATKDETLVASFSPIGYDIKLNAEHGTAKATGDVGSIYNGKYYYGKKITLTATPDDDYQFVRWEKDGELYSAEKSTTFIVDGDAEFTAVFSKIEHRDETAKISGVTYHLTDTEAVVTAIDPKIASLNLPDKVKELPVTRIESKAFTEGNALKEITIPQFMWSPGIYSKNVPNLAKITVSEHNNRLKDIDGVLFDKDGETLSTYPPDHGDTYAVPEGTKYITGGVFANSNIKDISFPSTLVSVGDETFKNCDNLTKLIFPTGLQTIGYNSVAFCDNLETVYVPSTVIAVRNAAFQENPKLTRIVVDIPADYSQAIYGMPETISSSKDESTFTYIFDGTIYGPEGGAGDVYAKSMGYKFVSTSAYFGDINLDGALDKEDDVALSRYVKGWPDIEVDPVTADINRDGEIDLVDSIILSCKLAGWTNYDTYFA